MTGLSVSVIGADCTAGGVTSEKTRAILVGPGVPEIFASSADSPALAFDAEFEPQGASAGYKLVADRKWASKVLGREVNEDLVVRARAYPVGREGGSFGGHYITTSDSRFPFESPLPVFDRFETPLN